MKILTHAQKDFIFRARIRIKEVIWCYLIPDRICLKRIYRRHFGKDPDLVTPKLYNEKIQWLKLHDRKPFYHNLVDKYEAKKIIGDLIGEEYIIETIGVWDNYEDIDFSTFPNQFVLKFTHDSGSVTVCTDKSKFDVEGHAGRYAHNFRNRSYYHREPKEWAYKGIKPRIIAEPFLKDEKYTDLTTYMFHCCNGKVKWIIAAVDKLSDSAVSYSYDLSWSRLHTDIPKGGIDKPKDLDKMFELAGKIARFVNNPFVRVDFYYVSGKIYFNEVTFYPNAGIGKFYHPEDDYLFGSWVDLSKRAK